MNNNMNTTMNITQNAKKTIDSKESIDMKNRIINNELRQNNMKIILKNNMKKYKYKNKYIKNDLHENINQIYNENNILITEDNIINILKKGNIHNITKIHNLQYFQYAFTHVSYSILGNIDITETKPDNVVDLQLESCEIFEFSGDSLLYSVIGTYLTDRFYVSYLNKLHNNKIIKQNDIMREGDLTKVRIKLIRTITLSKVGNYLGLNKYILLSKYIEQENGRYDIKNIEDIFEAFIGALRMELLIQYDEGFAYNICKQFIINIYEACVDMVEIFMLEDNYKDQLMRYYQTTFNYLPTYELLNIIEEENTNNNGLTYLSKKYHICIRHNNIIIGEAINASKKTAEQEAACIALKYFNNDQHIA